MVAVVLISVSAISTRLDRSVPAAAGYSLVFTLNLKPLQAAEKKPGHCNDRA